MYNYYYYKLYNFVKSIKENIKGSALSSIEFDPIFLFSIFESLNIATLWLIFDFESITTNYNLDFLIVFLIFLSFNYLYFIKNEKYKIIIKKCRNKNINFQLVGDIVSIIYTILSIYLFVKFH
jgi:hypothetical protein